MANCSNIFYKLTVLFVSFCFLCFGYAECGSASVHNFSTDEATAGGDFPIQPSLRKYLPNKYDKYEPPRPMNGSGPLDIAMSVKARDLQNIDEQNMDVTIEWFIRLFWTDDRLIYPDVEEGEWENIGIGILDYVWLPTVFIDHVREVNQPKLIIAPVSFRMQSNGLIRFSTSVTTRISCPMDFTAYPFDSQTCYYDMESYQLTPEEVSYRWVMEEVELGDRILPVHFDFKFTAEKQKLSSHQNRSFPRLSVKLQLWRRASYHMINTYVPSALFVMISWMTFLVPIDQVPGRMVLTITTLLTLVSMFASVRNESPKVSYAKAIDQWMIMCVMFVFIVLTEFTTVLKLNTKAKEFDAAVEKMKSYHSIPRLSSRPASKMPSPNSVKEAFGTNDVNGGDGYSHKMKEEPDDVHDLGESLHRFETLAMRSLQRPQSTGSFMVVGDKGEDLTRNRYRETVNGLEKWGPIILPIIFCIFNVIYWSVWLTYENADFF